MSSKVTEIDTILKSRQPKKILQETYDLNPKTITWLLDTDEKKFDKFIKKVARVIKKNRKLVNKIRGVK